MDRDSRIRPRGILAALAVFALVLSATRTTAQPPTVVSPEGRFLRHNSPGAASQPPHSPGSAPDRVSRSSRGVGFTIDAAGLLHRDASAGLAANAIGIPDPAPRGSLVGATIDSMLVSAHTDSYFDRPSMGLLSGTQRYFLSDGTSWTSGAGSYHVTRAVFDHVERDGSTLRYYLLPPHEGRVYEQTDFNSGEHSSQGRLDCTAPLLLEAQVGSDRAILRGNAVIVANDPTWYGEPRFNYFSRPVGSVVPFEIEYTLQGGTWSEDTFSRAFSARGEGWVRFTREPYAGELTQLSLGGASPIRGENTFRYRAVARFDTAILEDVSDRASWRVEPAALGVIDRGQLTTLRLDGPEAMLELGATLTEGAVTRSAVLDVRYLAPLPASTATDWPMYQADARHTGYRAVSHLAEDFRFLWSRDLTPAGITPVTATDGRVFCSSLAAFSSGTTFWALDARSGVELWSRAFSSPFSVNAPSCAAGKVYVQTGNHGGDTWLRAFSAETGALVFETRHGAQWERYYAPTLYEGNVYLNGGAYGGMLGFDGTTGAELWFAYLPQYDRWTPAVEGESIYAYLGHSSPGLFIVDRASGSVLRRIDDPNFEWNGWSMDLAPLLGPNSDVFAIHDGRLINFDVAGGTIRWERSGAFQFQPSLAGGTIYAIDSGRLLALDETSGGEKWSWNPPAGGLTGNIIVTESHLWVASNDRVDAIDLASRQSAWSYPSGGQLALADGVLFIASASGRLTAIEVAPPVPLVADAGPDIAVECAPDGGSGTAVRLDGTASLGGDLSFAWSAADVTFDDATSPTPVGRFPLGTTAVQLRVTRGASSAIDTILVTVADTTPPTLALVVSSPVLWPPNGELVPVLVVAVAADACDAAPAVRLVAVTSSEEDSGPGDIQGASPGEEDFELLLRAEREGTGPGRAYTLEYVAMDASGNHGTQSISVVVPHDLGGRARLAATPAGARLTLDGAGQPMAAEIDPGSIRIVRPGLPDLHEQGDSRSLDRAGAGSRAATIVDLECGASDCDVPPGAFALWTTAGRILGAALRGPEVVSVGDSFAGAARLQVGVARNPARGEAVIRYSIPASGVVRIEVWDVLGRRASLLVDRLQGVGSHEARFVPGSRAASQLYFYRVEWEGQVERGRFVLLD